MEGHCSTGQSPQWAVVPMEEEEELFTFLSQHRLPWHVLFGGFPQPLEQIL